MRVTSFDVFDTLLTRTFAAPVHVFSCVGARLGRPGFAAERTTAERAARRAVPSGEVTLAGIYERLGRQPGWSQVDCDAAMTCELAVEEQHVQAIGCMRPVVAEAREKADQVVFLSDMYLPGEVIRSWLQRAGFWREGDRLYVSGEQAAGKGSGALFEKVHLELSASFGAWNHYGDHRWSDFKKPRALGIQAHRVTASALTPRERISLRPGLEDSSASHRSLLAGTMRCARLSRNFPAERDRVLQEVATGVAGPLFYGFVRWCLAGAIQRGIRRLYFLSRGGQVMWRVAQEICRQLALPVECRYLYTSRLAFTGPAAADEPARLRLLVASTSRQHSVRQAFANLGLDEAERPNLVPAGLRSDWNRNLEPAERTELADALLLPEHRERVRIALAARAELAGDYLVAEGLDGSAPMGLVDTGWFGSIQRSIGEISAAADRPARLTGFYLGLVEQTGRKVAGEMLGYANTFNRLPLRRQTSHLVLMELLAQADHGPLAGFRRETDGRVMPVFDAPGPVNLEEIRSFQEDALNFVRIFLATACGSASPGAAWHWAALEIYRQFHDRPAPAEARVFGRMPHADQLKEASFDQLAPPLGMAGVFAAMSSSRRRPPCWWIEGQAALEFPRTLHACILLKRLKWRAQTALTGLRD